MATPRDWSVFGKVYAAGADGWVPALRFWDGWKGQRVEVGAVLKDDDGSWRVRAVYFNHLGLEPLPAGK